MRYIWRGIRLLIIWPCYIIIVLVGTTMYNFFSILWYFDYYHLEGIENFWYPITSRTIDEDSPKLFDYYDEYYKTPMDLLLDRRTRIYEKNESSTK